LNVAPDFGNDVYLRLDLPLELSFHRLEIGANRFEHLHEIEAGLLRSVDQARQSHHRPAKLSTQPSA
jgi:hypothetical protein